MKTLTDLVDEWYYIAYKDYLDEKITYDLWEEIKYTINEWKKAQQD